VFFPIKLTQHDAEREKQCNDIKLNSFQQYLFSVCALLYQAAANRFNIFNDESAYTEAIKKSQSLQKKEFTHTRVLNYGFFAKLEKGCEFYITFMWNFF
jgi:hypothetical protein